ncbi:hypothetical protein [Lysobacter antibioticus]|uniref:Uncharacterized protein n=1 Tax=Lysobacter antibioticus TaxID=84531 RepID=A0A0S2FFD8_LYSAN|nr:hypothetical protein [Lysobacter antibioticus]ALN82219.1 hypothetical protein LA76x_4103 [Lysobacter antibioticus]
MTPIEAAHFRGGVGAARAATALCPVRGAPLKQDQIKTKIKIKIKIKR